MRLVLLSLLAAGLAAPAARAQMEIGPQVLPNNYVLQSQLQRDLFERATGNQGAAPTQAPNQAAPTPAPVPAPAPAPAPSTGGGGMFGLPLAPQGAAPQAAAPGAGMVTTYQASPEVTQRVREQFLGWVQQRSGAETAGQMRQVMQQQDVLALWAQQMAADGLKPGDVVDALTAYWVQNWQMAHGVENTTPAQVMGVRAQVAPLLARNEAFGRMNDAQRQEMAEMFIYNQFLQGSAWVMAGQQNNPALKAQLGEAAVQRFRTEMNIDLKALQLTDRGFVKRS
ncbi:hypothetical protein BKE38_09590 [Pseudoroseomonas deserti]|uniref:DUF2059 domain-containing protein n=1 Tax=Teichococcus deserti TaxID=1817963 RepID=A0A1V2H3G3_9PROT|nr:DUF6683 family protein [Pseudoroseomonas deserti]ONG54975.1 hypothetical protein BKE38_09590 [Pseudoroseomonas deserti]